MRGSPTLRGTCHRAGARTRDPRGRAPRAPRTPRALKPPGMTGRRSTTSRSWPASRRPRCRGRPAAPTASVPGPPRRSWPPPASWATGRPPKSAPTGPSATRAATCWAWWSRTSSTRSSRSSCSARLQLTTDDGVVGVGDATLNGRELAVASYLKNHVAQLLVGRDARKIEDTWQFLYRSAYWRRGPVTMAAIAAVDMALWDIKGKMAGRRSTTCWAVRRAPAPALTATPRARAWSRCSTPSATRWSSATP